MEITGVRFFTIHGSKDELIDLRFVFTVSNGHQTAMYGFDKNSTKKSQSNADAAIEKSKQLARMKEKVSALGTEADSPHSQRVTASVYDIVPNDEGAARIVIGSGDKGNFAVRLAIPQKKAEDKIVLHVPFKGSPGALGGKVFNGQAFFMTDGSREVADAKLEIMAIGN